MGASISSENGAKRQKISNFQLENIPDEIILKVLNHLDIKHLFRCAQLCKRIYSICQDSSVYQHVNLSGYESIPTKFVKFVLEKGCKHLILRRTTFEGDLALTKKSQLKSLDLYECEASEASQQELLKSCHSLQKITLKYFTDEIKTPFDNGMGGTIYVFHEALGDLGECLKLFSNARLVQTICNQNALTLQTLHVSGAHISFVKAIVDNCVHLRELNIVNSMIGEEELSCLVNNLTSKVEILSFHHVDKLNDGHVDVLVKRCSKLKVLDLRKTVTTKKSLRFIAQNLRLLEELHTSISCELNDLHQLSLIPKLK